MAWLPELDAFKVMGDNDGEPKDTYDGLMSERYVEIKGMRTLLKFQSSSSAVEIGVSLDGEPSEKRE